jgi:hypothetical protein
MDEKERSTEDKNPTDESNKGKKPYHKPSFRYEHVFETMALACGKVSAHQGGCKHVNRKNS